MARTLIAALLLAAFWQAEPALRSRSDHRTATQTEAKGVSTLPEEASGEYVLDAQGSVVQITIEHGRLSGYVTKMDGRTALTLFFDRTSVHGNRVSFTTRTVHGLRYSFRGRIARGEAEDLRLSGFYQLDGELTLDRGLGRKSRRVSLKSTPRPR